MSFKTKALGLAAATALSLSIVTGAMAANPGDTSVTLQGHTGTGCGLANLGTASFGTSSWVVGAGYSNPANQTLSFDVTWDPSMPGGAAHGSCDAMISGTNFTSGANSFGVGAMSYKYGAGTTTQMTTGSQTLFTGQQEGTGKSVDLSLDLSGVTAPSGSYTSTLTITVSG